MQTMVSTAGSAPAPQVGVTESGASDDGLAPGAKAGPWVVERELGRGGMGAVYAVVHEEIGKRAALKVMHRRLLTPSFNVERVLLEAKVVNAIGHPNIVDIFETGTLGDGRPYIVMERLDGMPLSYRADESKLLPTEVISILLQCCDALVAAHAANVVHRDLKLDNVFLVQAGPDDPTLARVKILDWGIAKVIDADVKHTMEGQLVGTPQYLSPEQARGTTVTPQSDVYSLGVMAYEMFLEQLPFEAETSAEIMAMHLRAIPPAPSDMWPDIPPELERLLLTMLAKSPTNRPTMKEVASTLTSVFEGLESKRVERAASVVAPLRRLGSNPIRAISRPGSHNEHYRPDGFSPTMPATDSESLSARRSRRWKLSFGAAAIAVSALMFGLTRDGEPAKAEAAPIAPAAAATEVATPTERAPAPLPIAPPNIAPVVVEAAPEKQLPARAPKRSSVAGAVRIDKPAPRANAARRPATHDAPAVPRRAARLDPNAVMDAYE